ncbi:hypothetical protein [Anabaena azotica]|uniref:hypothetical protein n=1 Tax=Anabaena azotica TaxID=197653 RepID=UPI0039A53C29
MRRRKALAKLTEDIALVKSMWLEARERSLYLLYGYLLYNKYIKKYRDSLWQQ